MQQGSGVDHRGRFSSTSANSRETVSSAKALLFAAERRTMHVANPTIALPRWTRAACQLEQCVAGCGSRKLMQSLVGSSDGVRGLPGTRQPDQLLPIESVDRWGHRAAKIGVRHGW